MDKVFSGLLGSFKSWISCQSEATYLSKDFWMPDQSCRVCYGCDSQFTLIKRKHHCRHCGRIFCANCTSIVSVSPNEQGIQQEERDRIRVCNYCYEQLGQGQGSLESVENGIQTCTCSSCTSSGSFLSAKSGGTCDNNISASVSAENSIEGISVASSVAKPTMESQNIAEDDVMSQNQIRSNDEDEESDFSHLGYKMRPFSEVSGYYGLLQFDRMDDECRSCKSHSDEDPVDSLSVMSTSLNDNFDPEVPEECEMPSSVYASDNVDSEPVDFEKNGVLWLPPDPDDEQDEREIFSFGDDDDGESCGEWGYLHKFGNSASGLCDGREKTNEEHNRVMKNAVDGHFRALVAQLLQVENLATGDENDKESWLPIITTLSWEVANFLKPDMSTDAQMDPGGYVKVKCLASGNHSESMVIRGVVCKKNLAHRRMRSKIEKPRLLLLGGSLEYQRVSNALSSVDTLLQQEIDHLKMAVARIDSYHPNVLLVEKTVSRYAQECLLAKNISLVLNVKRPLLERIARCCGSQIVPSIDHLSDLKLGYCDVFHVEKFTEEHETADSAKKPVKTLMYFEGCPKPLGCTVLLRGASRDELKKVKHVLHYGVFAAYQLALETSFLADEGASLPALPVISPITVPLPNEPLRTERSISSVSSFTAPEIENHVGPQSADELEKWNSVTCSKLMMLTFDTTRDSEFSDPIHVGSSTAKLATSSFTERLQNGSLDEQSHSYTVEGDSIGFPLSSEEGNLQASKSATTGNCIECEDLGAANFQRMQDGCFDSSANQIISYSSPDDFEFIEKKIGSLDEFPPSSSEQQSILVSLSSRCLQKGTVCERPHFFRIKYYGNTDKPLGRFLRDYLFNQNYRCQCCEMQPDAHVQCYTHRQGTLTISVKKLQETQLPGERDRKIWMWHRCLRCPRVNGFPPATRRVVMSDAAWGLSFGKFLELSFSNHAAASRVASCGHSLHRDCLRFYGFGKMVACFRYAPIDVYLVHLPPPMLEFNCRNQEWIEKEFIEIAARAELLFSELLNALRILVERKSSLSSIKISDSRRHLAELEEMLQKGKSEFEAALQKIFKAEPRIDILELNRLHRELALKSYIWDHCLKVASSLKDEGLSEERQVDNSDSITLSGKTADLNKETGKVVDSSSVILPDIRSDESTSCSESHECSNLETLHHSMDSNGSENQRSPASCNQMNANRDTDAIETVENTADQVIPSDGVSVASSETPDAAPTSENVSVSEAINTNYASEDNALTTEVPQNMAVESHHEELALPSRNDAGSKCSIFSEYPHSSFDSSILYSFGSLDPYIPRNALNQDPSYTASFWDPELQSGARLLLPVGANGIVVPVYDAEPTSAVSYALVSPDYHVQLSDELERPKDTGDSELSYQSSEVGRSQFSIDTQLESNRSQGQSDEHMISTAALSSLSMDSVTSTKALHAKVTFSDDCPLGKVKYTVTCYFAKHFEALRRKCCPSEVDFIRSLSRCRNWGAQGGKSNVFFAKTLDDRFIVKQVTKTELESFIKFGPEYFKYLSESVGSGSPTCLAKIVGIYQVMSKHVKGGKESKMDLLVMENLLFGKNVPRLYDLKGSTRSRYNSDCTGNNKVLLDENLIEAMPTSPIFIGNKAKRLLERAVWNDTSFLASVDVMDYSLLVGVDEERHELVLGIIDFLRQYTWDKHLETWVKASGILGGPKNASPTVISPKQYKRRFRKAMNTYFLVVPDQWSPSKKVEQTENKVNQPQDKHETNEAQDQDRRSKIAI